MKLVVERKYKGKEYTIGKLYVDGVYFCDTLEDTDRGLQQSDTLAAIKAAKIYGKTAVPTGTYPVSLTHSPKFKRVLPILRDVKGFTGIRIHRANTADDITGCIAVGENKRKGMVINSTFWEKELMLHLRNTNIIHLTIK